MADKAITAEQMRHYDSYTINTIGIPSLVSVSYTHLGFKSSNRAVPLNHWEC